MNLSQFQTKVYFLTKSDSGSFTNADMFILLNNAIERVTSLILKNDARWQYDDSNQTDLPEATTILTSGQQDYSLATTHVSVDRVEVKDSSGNWHLLTQIDRSTIDQESLTDYQKTNGLPAEYDLVGNSVILYPAPNYTQTNSLKIYFTRPHTAFTASDLTTGTAVLGFNPLFHDIVPFQVAYEYAVANGLNTANNFLNEVVRREQEMEEFYGLRNRALRPRFTVSTNQQVIAESGRVSTRGGDSNK